MGFMLPAALDALPTLSDGFLGSKLPGIPGDLISQPSTGPMSSLLILLGKFILSTGCTKQKQFFSSEESAHRQLLTSAARFFPAPPETPQFLF